MDEVFLERAFHINWYLMGFPRGSKKTGRVPVAKNVYVRRSGLEQKDGNVIKMNKNKLLEDVYVS